MSEDLTTEGTKDSQRKRALMLCVLREKLCVALCLKLKLLLPFHELQGCFLVFNF